MGPGPFADKYLAHLRRFIIEYMEQDPLKGDHYRRLKKGGEALLKDRGSKFYAYAFPASSGEEAEALLQEVREAHHSARHHCYAYRTQPKAPVLRINDDGEPSHSAGTPIFHALQSAGLWDTGVVVTRYFGGTKLGVSGLIQAYRGAAEAALAESTLEDAYLENRLELRFPYELMAVAMNLLQEVPATIDDEQMGVDAGYRLRVRRSQVSTVIHKFEERKGMTIKVLDP